MVAAYHKCSPPWNSTFRCTKHGPIPTAAETSNMAASGEEMSPSSPYKFTPNIMVVALIHACIYLLYSTEGVYNKTTAAYCARINASRSPKVTHDLTSWNWLFSQWNFHIPIFQWRRKLANGKGRGSHLWVPRLSVRLLLQGPTYIGPFATLALQIDRVYLHTWGRFSYGWP